MFVEREVTDSLPQILEQCCRRLNSLLSQWKTVAQTAHNTRVLTADIGCYMAT